MQAIQQQSPVLQKLDFSNMATANSGNCATPNQFLHAMAGIELKVNQQINDNNNYTSPPYSFAQEPSPPNQTISLWEENTNASFDTLTMGFEPTRSVAPSKRKPEQQQQNNNSRASFLEKNRVAAMKCRQKKKEYVTNLELKAERLESDNYMLKNELERCRIEIDLLRSKFQQ